MKTETLRDQRPNILQGGMGIGVSSWRLARSVANMGEVGIVSGTCIDTVMVRELQEGDPYRRREAMKEYPDQEIVDDVIDEFYVEGGKPEDKPYRLLPIHQYEPSIRSQRILSLAAFSEVHMAKKGHDGVIGMNLMAKLKRYTLPSLYGAMIAGVDAVFMGAGIPMDEAKQVPKLAAGNTARLKLNVDTSIVDESEGPFYYTMNPSELLVDPPNLSCPAFYPIIASDSLARIMDRKVSDELISGWVIEGHTAGGHNAPPRNKTYDDDETPVYNEKDEVNLKRIRELDKPFYLAGGYGTPEAFREAIEKGAAGIQVGSLFSLTDESGYPEMVTRKLITAAHEDRLSIRTSGRLSPTGFPFKVIELEDERSGREKANQRDRLCDLGYLRSPVLMEKETVRGRCPAEPEDDFARKGGDPEKTKGRACLCNALFANIGLPQQRENGPEPRILTGGDQLEELPLGSRKEPHYSVEEVIHYLYGKNGEAV